jgi:hypothetical protein
MSSLITRPVKRNPIKKTKVAAKNFNGFTTKLIKKSANTKGCGIEIQLMSIYPHKKMTKNFTTFINIKNPSHTMYEKDLKTYHLLVKDPLGCSIF